VGVQSSCLGTSMPDELSVTARSTAHQYLSTAAASIPHLYALPRQALRRGYFEYLRFNAEDQ